MIRLVRDALTAVAVLKLCILAGSSLATVSGVSGDVPPEPNRTVKYYVDSTFTHKAINYNIQSFNCATFVHFVLQGYGIMCDFVDGAVALPECQCDTFFGCSGGSRTPGNLDSLVQDYMHNRNFSNETNNPSRMTLHVADLGLARSLLDAKHFEIEVVRTFVVKHKSYHVSLLGRWWQGNRWRMISLSGWPFDTIHSWNTIKYLFTGNFTVAFPDPTMRRAYLENESADLNVMARLNDSVAPAQLPGNASQIKSCETGLYFSWIKFKLVKTLRVQVEGVAGNLTFIEQDDPARFLQMVEWPIFTLQLKGGVWEYDLNPSKYSTDLPLEVALVEFEGTYFMQRPLISTWMRTLFTLMVDNRTWTPSVRPAMVSPVANAMYV